MSEDFTFMPHVKKKIDAFDDLYNETEQASVEFKAVLRDVVLAAFVSLANENGVMLGGQTFEKTFFKFYGIEEEVK